MAAGWITTITPGAIGRMGSPQIGGYTWPASLGILNRMSARQIAGRSWPVPIGVLGRMGGAEFFPPVVFPWWAYLEEEY